jgi:ribosomal protein S13
MFLLKTKLLKNKDLIYSLKSVHSYGIYRRRFLSKIFWYEAWAITDLTYTFTHFLLLKFYTTEIFKNIEMQESTRFVQIELKKNLQTYQGLWLALSLPVNGQRTRTNASTQRMLAHIPRKRHFLQWRNRRKFAPKENKRNYLKNKIETDEKKIN